MSSFWMIDLEGWLPSMTSSSQRRGWASPPGRELALLSQHQACSVISGSVGWNLTVFLLTVYQCIFFFGFELKTIFIDISSFRKYRHNLLHWICCNKTWIGQISPRHGKTVELPPNTWGNVLRNCQKITGGKKSKAPIKSFSSAKFLIKILTLIIATYFHYYLTRGGAQSSSPLNSPF